MRRPNFLIFVTDQQRADHLGCYGDPVLRTPAIDALAATGVAFDSCYVASPVCMPNRSAFMTGRMPSACGARMNGVPLPLSAYTHVDALRGNGWRTALIGKCHLQNMTEAPPAWRAAEPGAAIPMQASTEHRTGPGYAQESMASWRDPGHSVRTPYYGFDHVELCVEHGDLASGDYARWLAAKGVDQAALAGSGSALKPAPAAAPQAWRTAVPEELYPSAFVRDRTIAWLADHARQSASAPFYLQCSFPDPHHPFTPPGRWFDRYRACDVALPSTIDPTLASGPPVLRAVHEERAAGRRPDKGTRVIAVTADEAREAIALNYGSIAMIDAMVGDVVAALGRLGLADDTVIVFMSDHGDFMGDHGLLFKGTLHYRSVVRTPLVWRDPAIGGGRRCAELASTIDLAPTILRRAGLPLHHGLQGHDLAPLLAGDGTPVRDSVLIEEEGHRMTPGLTAMPKVRSLVTRRWRLSVHAHESWGELYDLETDPSECVNRWGDPALAEVREELLWRLAARMAQAADDCPLPDRAA